MQTSEFKNILIIQTGFIGDVVLSTPVISVLRERYADARISLVTTPVAAELFKNDSRLHAVIPFDKRGVHSGLAGFFKFLKIIRVHKFDCIFSLHKSFRTSLLVLFSGALHRFGFKESKLSWVYSGVVPRSHYEHDVLRNLAICENVGLDARAYARPMSLQSNDIVSNKAKSILSNLQGKKIIAVAPGSVWNTKRWTEEGFAALIGELIERNFGVALIGGKGDLGVVEKILSLIDPKHKESPFFLNTAGSLNLQESAALISQCNAIVTNDSAPLHIASAYQIPLVALFCATVPEFGFGPWKTKSEVVQVDGLSCKPCRRHGSNNCPTGTNFCRTKISHQMVFSAIERVVGT